MFQVVEKGQPCLVLPGVGRDEGRTPSIRFVSWRVLVILTKVFEWIVGKKPMGMDLWETLGSEKVQRGCICNSLAGLTMQGLKLKGANAAR